ncbi:Nucleolar protein 14-like protein [Diplonema papillatum]|nr:Nucleolar protein 14-like protein [Diplonema papillatum]
MKRRQKIQKYKARKAKEVAHATSQKFINPRDVKGVRGIELRDSTLGKEFVRRFKAGGIVDKREGGDEADETAMLTRMRKVRERKADKYNLGDGKENLTHYGTALGDSHANEADDGPFEHEHRKSRDEVLDEIIEKSKAFREEKKAATAERDAEIKQLDYDWKKGVNKLVTMLPNEKTAIPTTSVGPPMEAQQGAGRRGRVMVLGTDGTATVRSGSTSGEASAAADAEKKAAMDQLLTAIRAESQKEAAQPPVPAKAAAEPKKEAPAELDEYDKLLQSLEASVIVKGGYRSKSAGEVANEAQAELLKLHREKSRRMQDLGDDDEEPGADGGTEKVFQKLAPRAGDADHVRNSKAKRQASFLFESYLCELEKECTAPASLVGGADPSSFRVDFQRVDTILEQLRTLSKVSPLPSTTTARGLIEVLNDLLQREILEGAPATPFSILIPAVFGKIFPGSDFRHPVTTPLALLLSSSLQQVPFANARSVYAGTFRAAVLCDLLHESKRYCGELVTFLANVLSQSVATPHTAATAAATTPGPEDALAKELRANPVLSESLPLIPTCTPAGQQQQQKVAAAPSREGVFYGLAAPSQGLLRLAADDAQLAAARAAAPGQTAGKKKRKKIGESPAGDTPPPFLCSSAVAPLDFSACFCEDEPGAGPSADSLRLSATGAAYSLLLRHIRSFKEGAVVELEQITDPSAAVGPSGAEEAAVVAPFVEAALQPVKQTLLRIQQANAARSETTGGWLAVAPALKKLHDELVREVDSCIAACVASRTPLLLQSHRPVPLPLFNCKITEFEEGEADERRALKKEHKAEKKAVVRQLRADARYLNDAKEKERTAEQDVREQKLQSMMTDLQAQRRMIKESDVAKEKLRSMQKRLKSK